MSEGPGSQEVLAAAAGDEEAKALVSALYEFNSRYFESHSVEDASKKTSDVQARMQDAVAQLEKLQDRLPKALYFCLRGRCLNVLPDHSPEAEQYLSRAVKHDPSQVEAWNALGESYWKRGNIQQAYDCFTGSLAHCKTKESLRNLSMVLRQMGQGLQERADHVRESVERAKEAVAMDVKDGTSWMILGNAYISLFFTAEQDHKLLTQSASAYAQAEKDPVATNNPDLHFNKATLHQYRAEYAEMLSSMEQAAALEPGWSAPLIKIKETKQFLHNMTDMISRKAKIKVKLIGTLVDSLSSPERFLGPYTGKVLVGRVGMEEGPNAGRVFVGAVAATITTNDRIPYAVVLVDRSGESIGLMAFNLAFSAQFNSGDILTVPDPLFNQITVQGVDEVNFWSIRVTDPSKLLVNGKAIPVDKLAPSAISITAFS